MASGKQKQKKTYKEKGKDITTKPPRTARDEAGKDNDDTECISDLDPEVLDFLLVCLS